MKRSPFCASPPSSASSSSTRRSSRSSSSRSTRTSSSPSGPAFRPNGMSSFCNDQLIRAAMLSLQIAAISATIALVLGTLASVALVRFRRFRGKTLMIGMISAPLVMPDVIIGLSLLLLVRFDGTAHRLAGRARHADRHHRPSTFGMAYVAVVVQSRLSRSRRLARGGGRGSRRHPARVFFDITLPIISPALVSGWLLSFTLSLDDLVIASFVNGPGSSTLPMVIFSRARLGLNPSVNAVATLIVLAVSIGVVAASWWIARQGGGAPARSRRQDIPADGCPPQAPPGSRPPRSHVTRCCAAAVGGLRVPGASYGTGRQLRQLVHVAGRGLSGVPSRLAALRHRGGGDGRLGAPAGPKPH